MAAGVIATESSQGLSSGLEVILITCSVALLFLVITSLALCWHLRKPKKTSQHPPSPMCKRHMSIHVVYPPTPHAIRLPLYCKEKAASNSFHLPRNYAKYLAQLEARTNSDFVLHASRLSSLSSSSLSLATTSFSRSNSLDSIILGMPSLKEEVRIPAVHEGKLPQEEMPTIIEVELPKEGTSVFLEMRALKEEDIPAVLEVVSQEECMPTKLSSSGVQNSSDTLKANTPLQDPESSQL